MLACEHLGGVLRSAPVGVTTTLQPGRATVVGVSLISRSDFEVTPPQICPLARGAMAAVSASDSAPHSPG
jgi:hypothetical protein